MLNTGRKPVSVAPKNRKLIWKVKSYNKSFPACVIAHRLYGSDNLEVRAADIQTRNGIANALFMPAGVDLEVEEA